MKLIIAFGLCAVSVDSATLTEQTQKKKQKQKYTAMKDYKGYTFYTKKSMQDRINDKVVSKNKITLGVGNEKGNEKNKEQKELLKRFGYTSTLPAEPGYQNIDTDRDIADLYDDVMSSTLLKPSKKTLSTEQLVAKEVEKEVARRKVVKTDLDYLNLQNEEELNDLMNNWHDYLSDVEAQYSLLTPFIENGEDFVKTIEAFNPIAQEIEQEVLGKTDQGAAIGKYVDEANVKRKEIQDKLLTDRAGALNGAAEKDQSKVGLVESHQKEMM